LRSDPYFQKLPPKSTGLEHFNPTWLDKALAGHPDAAPGDIQATLLELTATTIADAIAACLPTPQRLILCGGGARNKALMRRLGELRYPATVATTESLGIAPEWVEAAGFAWFAQTRLRGAPGNLPSVTGAREQVQLGGVYSGYKRDA
jgi:anhydro-N-acetylmuramic acid kinase